jgi:hypothetical protein
VAMPPMEVIPAILDLLILTLVRLSESVLSSLSEDSRETFRIGNAALNKRKPDSDCPAFVM